MPSEKTAPKTRDWLVSIPFSDLNALLNQVETFDSIRSENAQLRRELDGLRNMFNELMIAFADLKRELNGR